MDKSTKNIEKSNSNKRVVRYRQGYF